MGTLNLWILIACLMWFSEIFKSEGNVALNRKAFQVGGNSGHAERAVDGNTDPDDDSTCTFIDTGDPDVSAWWFVDLGREYQIHSVTVYNTNRVPDSIYLGEFYLRRSSDNIPNSSSSPGCGTLAGTTPRGQGSTLSCSATARYVMIDKRPSSDSKHLLTLCEVVVMATPRDCPDLLNPPNGAVTHQGITLNSIATYSCNEGFELIVTRKCTEDETWTTAELVCQDPCPVHCQCDDNNQCQLCNQWYVPDGMCNVHLKLATLDSDYQVSIVKVTQTTAVMQFKQDQDDVPPGYESHYFYQLLYKTRSNMFEIWDDSDKVTHVKGDFFVELTARSLNADTSYTFKAGLYRTHRGIIEKGYPDSKEIIATTLIAQDCQHLEDPANGAVTYSAVATYSCNEGFVLIGDPTRQCTARGTWTGKEPQCRGCPLNCYCDEINQCQQCHLWYVPDGACDVYIKPATLENDVDPLQQEVTQTAAKISFQQNQHDIPLGYENHYFYRLLFKHTSSFEILLSSSTKNHVSSQAFVNLTAKHLCPGSSYTFKAAIYRTHRGEVEKGHTDSKDITVDILSYSSEYSYSTSSVSLPSTTQNTGTGHCVCDGNTGTVRKTCDQLPLTLGVVFAVLAAIAVIIIVVFCVRRYHRKRGTSKGDSIEVPDADNGYQNQNTRTYENMTFEATDDSAIKSAGTSQEANYTSLKSSSRTISKNEPYALLLRELNPKEGDCDNADLVGLRIPVEELEGYIQKKMGATNGFRKEFKNIPTERTAKCEVGLKQTNQHKNRFKHILAYDHTRVVLDITEGNKGSNYINANYIKGYKDEQNAYVATQNPMKQYMADFWKMVWLLNTDTVVMLTQITQRDKPYWAEGVGAVKTFAEINVTTVSVECFADYTVHILSAKKKGEAEIHLIHHMHFTSWVEKHEKKFPLVEFLKTVRSTHSPNKGPMVVHCSSGIGRTGIFIALDYLLHQAKAENAVDVFSCVKLMRTQRMLMVQTLDQYIFTYETLLDALKAGNTSISCAKFAATYARLKGNQQLELMEQYQKLNTLTPGSSRPLPLPNKANTDTCVNNDIVPAVKPKTSAMRCDGFSVAMVPGFKQKIGSIATQMPIKDTVADFWKLVWDNRTNVIVMLNHLDTEETSEEIEIYWPDESNPTQRYGSILLERTSEELQSGYTTRNFKMTNTLKKNYDPLTIHQFQLDDWPRDFLLPPKPSTFTKVLESVHDCKKSSGNGPILVHCMNGTSRSGLFCTALYMKEKLQADQEIDIFTAVRFVHLGMPEFIESLDQYIFLHDVAYKLIQSKSDV